MTARNNYNNSGGPSFVTRNTTGQASAGHGDSGGANYYLGTSTDRRAKGVISAINGNRERPCRGVPTGDGRFCSDEVIHPEVQAALGRTGLSILVE